MAIVKYKNQSGVTYAYESISEWDPVKKQSRPKRKYLGRVDPETGEIISTAGKRGRPKKKDSIQDTKATDYKTLFENTSAALEKSQADLKQLKKRKEGTGHPKPTAGRSHFPDLSANRFFPEEN